MVRRWVWVVPIVFAVCIGAAIDYADLFDKDLAYLVVGTTLLIRRHRIEPVVTPRAGI